MEEYLTEGGLEASETQARLSVSPCLPADQDLKLPATAQCHVPCHDDRLTSETIRKPQINASFIRIVFVMVPFHSNRMVTKTDVGMRD